MRKWEPVNSSLSVLILILYFVFPAASQVSVLTAQNDNGRTGQNLQETVLNTSNVNVANFGKLFSVPVDGYVYSQPLYVPNLKMADGQTHNVVFVTTMHNSVYAIDADSGTVLWHDGPTSGNAVLGHAVLTDDICTANGSPAGCYTDVMPYIGITSTPVIDRTTNTIYVVVYNKDSNASYHHRLHALDITSGAEKFGGPTDITASNFVPFHHLQRPGLLLLNGKIYIAFGSAGDFFTWNGWVVSYDAQTLQQVNVFETTPQTVSPYIPGGGIWGGGKGLLTDGTYIYVATSNGYFNANTGGKDYASSFLKLTQSLTIADSGTGWFAPNNQYFLNTNPGNVDLGAGGPILLPGTSPQEIVGGGKQGVLYVLDTTNMGQYNASKDQAIQEFQATNAYDGTNNLGNGMIMGGPVFWNGPNGPEIYLWGPSGQLPSCNCPDYLKAWALQGQTFNTTPVAVGTIANSSGISNLAALSVSANGSKAGTGIIWASRAYSGEANYPSQPGILHAFDAANLDELWDSYQNKTRDNVGEYAKFNPPTVANGKVYLGTFVGPAQAGQDSGALVVYGLLAQPDFALGASPSSASVSAGQNATYNLTINPQNGFSGTVMLTYSGCPPQSTCTFNPPSIPAGSTSSTLTIATTAPSTARLAPASKLPLYALWLPFPAIALAGMGLKGSRKRRLAVWLAGASLLALVLLQAGCGGGGSSSNPPPTGGTPAGTYSVVVAASSGSIQHTSTLTLTVQ